MQVETVDGISHLSFILATLLQHFQKQNCLLDLCRETFLSKKGKKIATHERKEEKYFRYIRHYTTKK